MTWEPWQNGVKLAMGAMAKGFQARSWPRDQGPAQGHRAALKGFLSEGHGRFYHGRHDIFPRQPFCHGRLLPWLPWHVSHNFAIAPIAFFHA